MLYLILTSALILVYSTPTYGNDVIWDFEDGNDHGFTLWSVNPATPAANDPTIAGEEALTGVGGPKGLPDAGVVWSVGRPDQFDGQKPAFDEGDKTKADGTMEYNQPGLNHPFSFPVNSRDQESYLNTYNLTQWGDNVHAADNDQIATSPLVLLGTDAQLTVWVHGGGSGTHAPELDSNPNNGYTTDSAGVAVISAADGSLLASVLTNGHGTLREDIIDLSAFAGQMVHIEVVDAFQGSWGWIAVDEIRITNALELGDPSAFSKAWGPNPANGTLHNDTWANLSWVAGGFAVSHDVYIGDNFDDVNAGAEGTFVGNQGGDFIVVGFPGFPFPDGLIPGKTYYWRIDEVNETEPNSPWKGNVWSFSIPPKTAYFPDPADGAESVDVDATLSWTEGFGSKLHTVYFGDNFDEVNNATGGQAQGTTTYTPGTLKMAKTYYWRVDEFDIFETYKGDVWSFTTEGGVSNPDPAKGAVGVSQTPVLAWTPGLSASYDIYFGADPSALEKKASGNLGSESYEPGQLEWNTTYYWRVDEANSANADSPWTGPTWSFTTANFFIIDDMESYNDLDPADPASNRIFNAWIDGYDDPTNGALVGYDQPPFAEQTIVNSGNQSMPMSYDNSTAAKSEATSVLTANRDWTVNGVKRLTIWYRGSIGNAVEQMYVTLNGNAKVDHDDPDAATITGWTEWSIELQKFADQGVNFANVNSITIGLSSVTGGTGMMYFDDIRLYPSAP